MNETVKTTKKTYVMQGLESKRELDTYHLIFAPTFACNMHCRHCYLPDHNPEYLSEQVAMKLIDDWTEIVLRDKGKYQGIFHVKGGEPFIVPYFWNLVDKVVSTKSLKLMLTTNGTFCDNEIIEKLVTINDKLEGNLTVIVSLDGATEESNSKLRGKGHFHKAINFLEVMKDSGINLYLNCVLHKGNFDELQEYIDIAKEYSVTQLNFLNFIPRENAVDIEDWQVPHLRVYETFAEIYKNGDQQTRTLLNGCLPEIKFNEKEGYVSTSNECVAGYKGLLYILPNGNVFTCPNVVFSEDKLGNVNENSLHEIMINTELLHKSLKSFSGQYQCSGERKLYIKNNDKVRLKLLNKFSQTLSSTNKVPDKLSYCFNRNF